MMVTVTEDRHRRRETAKALQAPISRPPRPVTILGVTIPDPTTTRTGRRRIRMAGFRLLHLVETLAMTSESTPTAMTTVQSLLPMLFPAPPEPPIRIHRLLRPEYLDKAGWTLETTRICPTMSSKRSGSRPGTIRMLCRAVTLTLLCQIVPVSVADRKSTTASSDLADMFTRRSWRLR